MGTLLERERPLGITECKLFVEFISCIKIRFLREKNSAWKSSRVVLRFVFQDETGKSPKQVTTVITDATYYGDI